MGELRNGRIYNQEYHFSMTIRDGKISGVREYLDTQHVFCDVVSTLSRGYGGSSLSVQASGRADEA